MRPVRTAGIDPSGAQTFRSSAADARRGEQPGGADLDDDVRRPCQQRLLRRLHRFALDVREHVLAAGNVEHLVQEAAPAAHVQLAQCRRVALEHQQRARPGRVP